ncbi:MAG: substrate-binding domain-containing protein [Polyangiales bacterium]
MEISQIEQYHVLAQLGRGRRTDVFVVARPGLAGREALAVLKRLRASFVPAQGADESVALVADLRHPALAAIYEVAPGASLPFWVLEHIEGQPFDRVLQAAARAGGLRASLALHVVAEVLSALVYTHELRDEAGAPLGLAHGEVRSHDVFVSYYGKVKLGDFAGLRLSSARPSTHLAALLEAQQADLVAVGVLLWEALAQQKLPMPAPLTAADAQQMLPSLHELRPGLEPAVAELASRALQGGYATARGMLQDLQGLRRDPDTSAAELGAFLQQNFRRERQDEARRLQLLLTVDGINARPSTPSEPPSVRRSVPPPPLPKSVPTELPQAHPESVFERPEERAEESPLSAAETRDTLLPPPPEALDADAQSASYDEISRLQLLDETPRGSSPPPPPRPRSSTPVQVPVLDTAGQDGHPGARRAAGDHPLSRTLVGVGPATAAPPSAAEAEPGAAASDAEPSAPVGAQDGQAEAAEQAASDGSNGASSGASRWQFDVYSKKPDAAPKEKKPYDGTAQGWQFDVYAKKRPSELAPSAADDEGGEGALAQPQAAPSQPAPADARRRPVVLAAIALAACVLIAWLAWPRSEPEPVASSAAASVGASQKTPAALQPGAAVAAAPEVVLKVCGSNTIGAELAPALVEALLARKGGSAPRRHYDAAALRTQVDSEIAGKPSRIELSARGSATAFAGLADGSCDVGMASRVIDDAEASKLAELGLGDMHSASHEHVIGLDGVAVIVHPDNPLRALDRVVLHEIFTGKISDWSEIGGPKGKIALLARDQQSGTFDTFAEGVLGKDALAPSARRFSASDALADAVAADPLAIGAVGLPHVRSAKALAIGEPSTEPLLPTQFTVATEAYMLTRRLYLYTTTKPRTPWASELVTLALSPRGQEVAAKSQFIDLRVQAHSARCDRRCSPAYTRAISTAERLSVDFRFQPRSEQPDSRARRDFDRVLQYLQEHQGVKVSLLGFSDARGGAESNLRLSLQRARAVATELAMRGIQPELVTGFGADMPLASNDTEAGRERNRRVEIWIRR